ncbi:ATP-grasp domain-containing protein [Hyphobacterium sp.]|jgi:predicted ATP-grasp superfamily ATP-dependent carboligase|uniref:carboxylate--amine ligase n=1 Tax=Hyphobacterium sp. TaxID=2004662 RepID=UPI003BABAA0F
MSSKTEFKGRVVLTYGRSLMALSAAQVLHDHDIEVIGSDSLDLTVLQCSRHCADYFIYRNPNDDPEGFIDDLLEAIEEHRPEDDRPYVLMPLFTETAVIARHAERFEGKIRLALPSLSSIEMVEPKSALAESAKAAGVTAPETYHPKSISAVHDLTRQLSYPVLTKPIVGVGGRGIKKHGSANELEAFYAEHTPEDDKWPIIQKAVDGKDYCFCALCRDGEIVAHMAYRNLQSYPRDTGAGVLRETVDDAPFLEEAKTLLKHLNWNGVCEIDYRWSGDETDTPYLIEVNARYWAGLFHSIASGVEFPWLHYQSTVGDEVDQVREPKIGQKSKIPLLWLVALAQDIAEKDDYTTRLSQALHENVEETGLAKKMFDITRSALDIPRLARFIGEILEAREGLGEASADDFILPEDPKAALGVLFIATSLIRTGKLPPELKQD